MVLCTGKHIQYKLCIYGITKKGKSFDKEEFELNGYSVCKNEWIHDEGEKHLCPIPIENYKVSEISKAVDSFIEKEYTQ